MRKPLKAGAILGAAFLLPFAAFLVIVEVMEDGPYFPATEGAKWVYTAPDGEYEKAVVGVERRGRASLVTVVRTQDQKETWVSTYRVTREGIDLASAGGTALDPPQTYVRAKAAPGEKWRYAVVRDGTELHAERELVGRETVETPAGRFQTLRVDVWYRYTRKGFSVGEPAESRGSEWYAPGVGMVKRVVPGYEVVLKQFTPGAQ